jgi:hypothetical protein
VTSSLYTETNSESHLTMNKDLEISDIVVNKIYTIRGQKVMLDSDLAELYEVGSKVLNQAVKRNIERFPEDFMFTLTQQEYSNLRSQFVTSSSHGGRRTLPNVFTEQGVAMLSGVLKSDRAIKVNIAIMRAFISIKQILTSGETLQNSIDILRFELLQMKAENRQRDEKIEYLLIALEQMAANQTESKGQIGFKYKE